VRELPELFDLRVKARSLAYLFGAGAVLALLTLVFPHDPLVDDTAIIGIAVAALLVSALIYARADRVRPWHLHAAVAIGTAMIALANYYTEDTANYAVIFTWGALYAFYFFDLRAAIAHVVWIGIAYAVVLGLTDATSPVVRWLVAVGTPTIAGALIYRLLGRVRAQAKTAEARERALRQSESRTRLVLDSAPDAFITVDRDGVITTWNLAAERMFGWSAAEAIGQTMRELIVPAEWRNRHDERRRGLIESEVTGATELFDVELVRRDGSRFPGESTVSKVVVGDEVFISGFIRDVSERQRRQEEREALLREQAARAEAERVAEMVSGMQLLVDAALVNRTLDAILDDLTARVRGVLEADGVTIFLTNDLGALEVAASTERAEPGERQPIEVGAGFAGGVAAAREPRLAQDPDPTDVMDPGIRRIEPDSLIGVPLLAEGEVTGVLVVAACAPRRFTQEDLALLRLAADRVALAIDHARVYEREHRIAETLQRSLLPERLPQLPGLAVAARYLPAATEAEVGGDWYDVIPIAGGGMGLVMGDVAGKGLAAASMVGRLRSALRAYALEGHEPARVVEQLNRLVWTEAEDSQMATLLYVCIDPADNTVSWVNAGHPPALLLKGEGTSEYLEGGRSVPLGVMPFPTFEEVSREIAPGGTVVLYTDGLIEVPGEHIDKGMGKLASVVGSAPSDPEELADEVLRQMVPGQGASDDVALLVLQNTPIADRFRVEFPTQPEALAAMRGLLRRWLRHAHGSDQEIAEITTACGEAATNAIEHAGAGGGTPFELIGDLDQGDVMIEVRDYGAWRAPREGDQGRGIGLMRALMDEVEVTPTPEGTTVRLRRTLNGTPT
jgi:PAS domain S-box-containing protein